MYQAEQLKGAGGLPSTQDRDARQRREPASVWHRFGQVAIDVALWTLGIIGLMSLLAAIAAYIWGYSIILFSTGSMSPTIPAGSAALVQRVPASEVHVGDIVTVDRQDALPITHRVTSITPGTGPFLLWIVTRVPTTMVGSTPPMGAK